jgi:dolichyl-phosphate beta-glucosyltransferase
MAAGPSPCRWSVVIPAFNEAHRLPSYLGRVVAYFERRGEPFEVIVVDDGSGDATSEQVRAIERAHPAVRLARFDHNHGKGFAVRAGMAMARGALRLMADADGATPIAEVERLEAALERGADLAVGSRTLRDVSVARRVRPLRQVVGSGFNVIVRALGVWGVRDTQCGFKLFRGEVAADLFGALRTEGFGFDVELLLLAQRRGYRIAEVPIAWTDQPGSRVSVVKEGPRMLAQVIAARLRLGVGRGARRTT